MTPDPAVTRAAPMMLRAPALAAQVYTELFASPQETEERLLALAGTPVFAEMLWVASPSLAEQVERYRARPGEVKAKARRQMFEALAKYAVRATTRPTPFGAFAGVAAVHAGEATRLRLGAGHRRAARADFRCALDLAWELERDETARRELPFVLNGSAYRAGRRVYFTDPNPQGGGLETVNLRWTPVLDLVMERAARPVAYRTLADELTGAFPGHGARVTEFLATLITRGLLISTLRPALTGADPLGWVLAAVPAALRDHPASVAARAVQEAVLAYRAWPLGEGTAALREVYRRGSLAAGEAQQSLQVDLRLDVEGGLLGEEVVREAGRAADLLQRLNAGRSVTPHLDLYAEEFAERFSGGEVPLLELLDNQRGLGAPPTYEQPGPNRAWRPGPARGHPYQNVLQKLLARARGTREVELREEDVRDLPRPARAAPTADVFALLLAENAQAVDRGEFRLVIGPSGTSSPTGLAFARFAYLDPAFGRHLAGQAQASDGDTLHADLLYTHPHGHANNVALRPRLRDHQIVFGTTPSTPWDDTLALSDLLVGFGDGQFYLRDRRSGRRVVAHGTHMLNPGGAPNVVRFLSELGLQGSALPLGWDWGPYAELPFLPRVRFGRVILSPARWTLPEELRREPGDSAALAAWRAGSGVPRRVYLGMYDHRMLLDLEHELHRRLFAGLVRGGARWVEEALPDLGDAWLAGEGGSHLAELIIPVDLAPRADAARLHPFAEVTRREVLPGEEWLYAKLYGPPSLQDDVLALLAREVTDPWFYVRYTDPEHHLRVRLRVGDGAAPAFARLTPLLRHLRDEGLITRVSLDTYRREVERYGGEAALGHGENAFVLDSTLLTELLGTRPPRSPRERLATGVVTLGTLLALLEPDRDGQRHLLSLITAAYAAEFADDPGLSREALAATSGQLREPVLEALRDPDLQRWAQRYTAALAPHTRLWLHHVPDERRFEVVSSVLHMHANRLMLDRPDEYRALHLLGRTLDGLRHFVPEGVWW